MCCITQQLRALTVTGLLSLHLIQKCFHSRDAASSILQCKVLWPSAHGCSHVCLILCAVERERKRKPQSWTEMLWQFCQHLLCALLHLFSAVFCGDGGCLSSSSVAPALETPPEEWAGSHGLAYVPWLRDGQGTAEEQHLGLVSWDLDITMSSPQDQSARSLPPQQTWCTQSPCRAPASK